MKALMSCLLLLSITSFACDKESFRFCPGEKVATDNGHYAVVVGIFPDGWVSLKFSGVMKMYKWPIELLGKTKGCLTSDYCVGDKVVTDNGDEALINAIFVAKNKVALKFNNVSKFYIWPIERLAIIKACEERNLVY